MLISTNILRDGDLDFDYIVTDNAQKIFEALTNTQGKAAKCFNLIGSYGTGKSSFLVAFEQTLLGKQQFFDTKGLPKSPLFLKVLGSHASFQKVLANELGLKSNASAAKILAALEELGNKKRPVYVLVDELGKHLEYALAHNPKEETYFFQQVAEAINDPDNNLHWVGTLHQGLTPTQQARPNATFSNGKKSVAALCRSTSTSPPRRLETHEQEARLAERQSEKHRQGQPGHSAHTVDAQGIR